MTAIPGSVRVTGFFAPSDSEDTYAVHDETYGRGGWRTVADITARDAITADRRVIGMAVRVLDSDGFGNQGFFTLSGGITNSDWIEDNFGGGSLSVETVTETTYVILSSQVNTFFIFVNPSAGEHVQVSLPTAASVGKGGIFDILATGIYQAEFSTGYFTLSVAEESGDLFLWTNGDHTTNSIGTSQTHSKIRLISDGVNTWGILDAYGWWGEIVFGEGGVTFDSKHTFSANIEGSVEDNVVTFDSGGNIQDSGIPIVDLGGWRTVNTIEARDALPPDRRSIGMVVRVLDTGSGSQGFFTLIGGIENINWVSDDFGAVSYTNATPMPAAVGGWPKDSTFTNNTVVEMLDGLLYPYQYPAFSTFGIDGQAALLEVGDGIAIDRTFTWLTTNSSSVSPNSISLTDVTGSTLIVSGLDDDGVQATSYPAAPITKTTVDTHSFRIDGENTKLETFSLTYTVTWLWLRYYGESSNAGALIEGDIKGLRVKGLSDTFAGTYVFLTAGYKYIVYPASLGEATSFKDESTNLDVPFEDSYTVDVENDFHQTTSYRVHRTSNIIGSDINIVVS